MAGPLEQLRVLELGGVGPGPHAAMVLADLGADVVRIERPDAGPEVRKPGYVDHLLRGRRSLELDLKQPDDLAAMLDLVTAADVLIESYRPGVTERLGIGPDECAQLNPRLVYARVTGWGQTGPWATHAGHDINYIALTGVLNAVGRSGEPPVPPLNLVGDFGGGSMLTLVGILAALWERERSGRGQVVDATMLDGVSLLAQMIWSSRAGGLWHDDRGVNSLDGGAPYYCTYACADNRYVAVGALEDRHWATLLAALGLAMSQFPDRKNPATWASTRARLSEVFASRPRDAWSAVFDTPEACLSPVLSFAEAGSHPQMAGRQTLIDLDGVLQPAPAPRFSRNRLDRPAPPPAEPVEVRTVLAAWRAAPRPAQSRSREGGSR